MKIYQDDSKDIKYFLCFKLYNLKNKIHLISYRVLMLSKKIIYQTNGSLSAMINNANYLLLNKFTKIKIITSYINS